MSTMFDLSALAIKADPSLRKVVVPGEIHLDPAQAQAHLRAAALHSDAVQHGYSPRAAAWVQEVRRIHRDQMVADAIIQEVSGRLKRGTLTADSGSVIPPLALRSQIGPDIMQPTQDRGDILDTIPTRNVPGDDIGYFRRFIKFASGGGFVTIRGDQTEFNTVSYSIEEDLRPLHWAGIAMSRGWMEQRTTRAAGVNDIGNKLEAINRAAREYMLTIRLTGATGLDLYSLASVPGLLRVHSSAVLGTASIETARAAVIAAATRAMLASPADLKPDTVILTDRIYVALLETSALPTNQTNGWTEFLAAMSVLGISRIVQGRSLRDFGGSNIDGCLFVRSDATTGLAQVQGNGLAPVWTYNGPSGEVTVYAMSFGDLELPIVEGCSVETFEVSL